MTLFLQTKSHDKNRGTVIEANRKKGFEKIMFEKMKATKENFCEYITNNGDGIEKYLPILANELYDRFISKNTKKTLGMKQLYVNGVESTIHLNEKATAVDTAIADNELTDLLHKTRAFTELFKVEAHDHQFVEVLTDNDTKAGEAEKKPIILSFDDVVKGIGEQSDEEHTVYTDEMIAKGDFPKVPEKVLDISLTLLKASIEACLISVTLEMLIKQ